MTDHRAEAGWKVHSERDEVSAISHALIAIHDLLERRLPHSTSVNDSEPSLDVTDDSLSDVDAPASTDSAQISTESECGADQAPVDPPTRERASAGDSDEALAALIEPLLPCMPDQTSSLLSLKIARAAREHLGPEIDAHVLEQVRTAADAADENFQAAGVWRDRAVKAEVDRDGWKAKYAALREDVDVTYNTTTAFEVKAMAGAIVRNDAARDPQPDPDTVTLRLDDARIMYESAVVPLGEDRRIRAALGWGDEA